MIKLNEKQIKDLIDNSIFQSDYMFDNPIKKYELLLQELYLNNKINRTNIIKKYGKNIANIEKGNISDYRELLVEALKDKIELWSEDFWLLYSINNQKSVEQYNIEDSSKKMFPFNIIKKYSKYNLVEEYDKYLNSKNIYYYTEIDFWYKINKGKSKNNINSFVLNYPERHSWQVLNKIKFLTLTNTEQSNMLINKLLYNIKGSSVYPEAQKILIEVGIKVEDNNEEPIMVDEKIKVSYKKVMNINPNYFIDKYEITMEEANYFLNTLCKLLIVNNPKFKFDKKDNIKNDKFKNYEASEITFTIEDKLSNENDLENINNLSEKFKEILNIGSFFMLNKDSQYYILDPEIKSSLNSKEYIEYYMKSIENYIEYKKLESILEDKKQNDLHVKKVKI